MHNILKRLDRVKKLSESANRRSKLYSDLSEFEHKSSSNSLRALRKAPAPGGKMQKIGFLMLWIPEPTGITCAVGGPMIIAGKYLDRVYNGATINDIGNHTKQTHNKLTDFKKTLS